jgi:hypothetical protein
MEDKTMHVVLVAGDRHWKDRRSVWKLLDARARRHGRLYVVEGGASGADWCARTWRLAHPKHSGRTVEALWEEQGKAAGPIRNEAQGSLVARMMRNGSEVEVLLFHDHIENSKGTADMLDVARKLGLHPIRLIRHKRKVKT